MAASGGGTLAGVLGTTHELRTLSWGCWPHTRVRAGMVKQGLSPEEAAARFYVLDHHGLITQKVGGLSCQA